VSRREFRADVATARPPSAWVMAGVAGATLWITGQLELFVTGLQALALVLSLLRRENPWPWQKNAVWLNAMMFAVLGVTIDVAFRSANSVIALAHFAALAQGVQLLDARPRRSEFLLVALALFQVVLAANLTDSLLFLPLLVLFVFSTTWTLLVHTLRTEAAEAGDVEAAQRAITPGLLRTTLIATSVSIVLAALLFVLLPRMRSSIVNASIGGSNAVAGFSDRVELGTIGRIRKDSRVVLRVETLEGTAPSPELGYWRGLAFDRFDGSEWSITPPQRRARAGSPKLGIELARPPLAHGLVQQIVREPVQAGVLFSAGAAHRVYGALHSIESDVNGGLYDPSQFDNRVRYTISTRSRPPDDAVLQRDASSAPRRGDERFTALPDFEAGVHTLGERIVADAESDAEKARRLEIHLREHGVYTDAPPPIDTQSGRSPVEAFLLEERPGHCEYFASGMVVLARSLGLHARLVNGFAGGRVNRLGGFTELLRSDAHAWVEVHYEDAGWVRYDPTPPDRRLRAMTALSLGERLTELRSAVELWWFQRVVDFDSSDQVSALKAVWNAYHGMKEASKPAPGRTQRALGLESLRDLPWRDMALVIAAFGLAIFAWRRRDAGEAPQIDREYAAALRLLSKRGLRRGTSTTARDFASEASLALPASAASAFSSITEAYLLARFGGRAPGSTRPALAALRQGLASAQSAP
jgi:transglutaminase-like putative cysteine protease